MDLRLDFIDNSGHGYLKVPMGVFKEVINDPEDISGYSGIQANHVFLEEDCDASVFVNQAKEKGYNVSFNEVYRPNYRCPKNYCASLIAYGS